MAERFTRQATQQLNPVISQSQQIIQPNISATQQLFKSLVSGLEGEAATSVGDITADAYNRGVGRSSLAQDVSAGFDPTLAVGATGLGAQQAGQLSDLRVAGGQLQADKATLVNQLASSLQESDIDRRTFEQDKIAQDRAQQLAIREAQLAAAARSSRGGGGGGSPDDTTADDIQGWFNTMRGGDGNVSPDTYAEGLKAWVNAGGDEAAFHNKFQGFVNLSHSDDYYRAAQKKAEAQAYNQAKNVITGRF